VQREDLLLTSAQSVFAVAVLLGLHLSLIEAGLLFGLFAVQFLIPETHLAITAIYLILSVIFIFRNRSQIAAVVRATRGKQPASGIGG
jgi:cation:H+ antiporter